MRDCSKTWDRTAADDILDYAMLASFTATILGTAGLIAVGLPTIPTMIGMTVVGGIWVFTITPHLVAWWLGVSVDHLLGIPAKEELNAHSTHSDEYHDAPSSDLNA